MDYTPYYETMRRTRLLRGMTDAELDMISQGKVTCSNSNALVMHWRKNAS